MHRVLMVSPNFPPDTNAGAHRVRLLAPHLPAHGWEPTIVTVTPESYEGLLDPELADLLPLELRVIRARAWAARWTRRIGFGDLGLRAFWGLYRTCARLLSEEKFDALYVTILPAYPAMLGPVLRRQFGVPFILDYQDPWVGAWGLTVGGGPHGTPDVRSRISRGIASVLEPIAVRSADAITAVSAETYRQVQARNPRVQSTPCTEIPLGGEPADFDQVALAPPPNRYFDPGDGNFHLCYVGTLLPLGLKTLEAFLRGVVMLRDRFPALYRKLRLHFFGTSNLTTPGAPQRVVPLAKSLHLQDCLTEVAERIDYTKAIGVLRQASAILMLGSSERHYTASKLYPGLLARRPILAIYHEASSVVGVVGNLARRPTVNLLTFGDDGDSSALVEEVCARMAALIEDPHYQPADVDFERLAEYSASKQAEKLAAVLAKCRAQSLLERAS